jgi:hypothetical protein
MASRQRTGVAAILAGALYFAGQGGELVFDDTAGGLWVTLGIGGFLALAVAVWGLRELVGTTRKGRVGIRFALVGVAFLCLFAVHVTVEMVRTGDIPDNFVLFLIGLLLISSGSSSSPETCAR